MMCVKAKGHIALKEVLGTNCFENREDWRTFVFRATDTSSVEDP